MPALQVQIKLQLFQVPQIMRNQLYGCLHQLGPNLTRLNLGSGSGGSCSTVYQFHCRHHRQSILIIAFYPCKKSFHKIKEFHENESLQAFESTFLKGIPALTGLQEFTLRYTLIFPQRMESFMISLG